MSITFRVTSPDDQTQLEPVAITIRQLVSFRSYARASGILIEDLGDDEDISMTLDFEASIGRVALAVLARIFDYSEHAITLLEEAQFTQRQIRFYKAHETGEVMLAISDTVDGSIDLNLANSNAYVVLEALELPPESVGDLPLDQLRDRLADLDIRARFRVQGAERYLDRLDRLAAIELNEGEPRLSWA